MKAEGSTAGILWMTYEYRPEIFMPKACLNCGKPPPQTYLNYCDWECTVEHARKEGAVEVRPNGLPIRCVTASGLLLECEDGDHATYIFPVEVEYIGPAPKEYFGHYHGDSNTLTPATPEEVSQRKFETHALIYTDGHVALTLYEMCYAMWYLRKGELGGGSLWRKKEWKLTEESVKAIRARTIAIISD